MFFWIFFILIILCLLAITVLITGIVRMIKAYRRESEAHDLIMRSRSPYYRRKPK
jgi:uncharacterized membrane protein YozB (DUF420 family)